MIGRMLGKTHMWWKARGWHNSAGKRCWEVTYSHFSLINCSKLSLRINSESPKQITLDAYNWKRQKNRRSVIWIGRQFYITRVGFRQRLIIRERYPIVDKQSVRGYSVKWAKFGLVDQATSRLSPWSSKVMHSLVEHGYVHTTRYGFWKNLHYWWNKRICCLFETSKHRHLMYTEDRRL